MAAIGHHALVVVDRPYRGVLERAYADCFYLIRVLRAQLGAIDLVLRGEAVLLAARSGGWDGGLPALLGDGVAVVVERDDAELFGLAATDLLDGVRVTPPAPRPEWSAYDHVWFV